MRYLRIDNPLSMYRPRYAIVVDGNTVGTVTLSSKGTWNRDAVWLAEVDGVVVGVGRTRAFAAERAVQPVRRYSPS